MGTQEKFYVSHNDEKLGPFTVEQIQKKLDDKELFPTDYIYVETQEDWVMLFEYMEALQRLPRQLSASASNPPPPLPNVMLQQKQPVYETKSKGNTNPAINPEVLENTGVMAVGGKNQTATPPKSPNYKRPAPKPEMAPKRQKAPEPTTTPAANSSAQPISSDKINVKEGQIVLKLSAEVAEKIQIKLHGENDVSGATEIEVKAGPAEIVECAHVSEAVAGKVINLVLTAKDRFGNVDHNYNHTGKLTSSRPLHSTSPVKFESGVAKVPIQHRVAEKVEIQIECEGIKEHKHIPLQFKAGPAVRFVIDRPASVTTGEEAVITVKAVDEFGNVDTNYSGQANLEVEGLGGGLSIQNGTIRHRAG